MLCFLTSQKVIFLCGKWKTENGINLEDCCFLFGRVIGQVVAKSVVMYYDDVWEIRQG